MVFNRTVDVASQKEADHFDYITRDGEYLRDIGYEHLVTFICSNILVQIMKKSEGCRVYCIHQVIQGYSKNKQCPRQG